MRHLNFHSSSTSFDFEFKINLFAGKSHYPLILTVRRRLPPPATAVFTMKRCRRQSETTAEETVDVVDIEDISFSRKEIQEIRASLLDWYDKNRRDLPWRRISNGGNEAGTEEGERRAYAVWVSEVMLQQTRVQTVIEYFNRWMEKWPTIHHLAQETIEVWFLPCIFVWIV